MRQIRQRRWVGASSLEMRIEEWDVHSGGSWRFGSSRDGEQYAFRGCFHEVRPDRLVQTLTYVGDPDGVALEPLRFEDLGNGRTLLRTQSLVHAFIQNLRPGHHELGHHTPPALRVAAASTELGQAI